MISGTEHPVWRAMGSRASYSSAGSLMETTTWLRVMDLGVGT
jgi:hypothetical protein